MEESRPQTSSAGGKVASRSSNAGHQKAPANLGWIKTNMSPREKILLRITQPKVRFPKCNDIFPTLVCSR